jgi:protein-tyrosine kinase
MSRIHEALARARALSTSEEAQAAESSDDRDVALPPMVPVGWIPEQTTAQARPPSVRPVPSIPIGQPVPSNGHDLSKVWAFSPQLKEKLVVEDGVDHAAVEQYRRLAGVLHLAQAERGPEKAKIVMISSSVSAEGKTLTCVNLALTLSESYHRSVLLVDGDLRRPRLHEVFQVPNIAGLNETLISPEAKIPVLQVSERLSLITAGRPASDPMRVLSSQRMEEVLEQARARFDWVLLDTPPVTLLTDASLLVSKADLVILVVEAGKTSFDAVQRAVDAVGRDRLIGVVLNRVQEAPPSVYANQEREETKEFQAMREEGN